VLYKIYKSKKRDKKMATKKEEEIVRLLLKKAQEKDSKAEPYQSEVDRSKIEEITKKIKKDLAEKK
jgi:hypothetical protein